MPLLRYFVKQFRYYRGELAMSDIGLHPIRNCLSLLEFIDFPLKGRSSCFILLDEEQHNFSLPLRLFEISMLQKRF